MVSHFVCGREQSSERAIQPKAWNHVQIYENQNEAHSIFAQPSKKV